MSNDELVETFQHIFPREFQIAALTLTNHKLRKHVEVLEELDSAVKHDAGFWEGTEKPVPLRAEKG
jgi:hypothetical protein